MSASRTIGLALALCISTVSAARAAPPSVCELATKRGGLSMYGVDVSPDQNGDYEILADIDGDGLSDKISWSDLGSGSIIPADLSTVTVMLSSSGKSFAVEQQRLHVVKYLSSYFVIAGWVESERGPWHRDVYAITRDGITKICQFSGNGLGP